MSALANRMPSITFGRLSVLFQLRACQRTVDKPGKICGSVSSMRSFCTESDSTIDSKTEKNVKNQNTEEDLDIPVLSARGPYKHFTDVSFWKTSKRRRSPAEPFNAKKVSQLMEDSLDFNIKDDMPIDMPDPYAEPYKRCILCVHNSYIDYKNTKLLSQFVSNVTGRIYGRHITGLCVPMQRHIAHQIRRSRDLGFMPYYNKMPEHFNDPDLRLKQFKPKPSK